jgi:hypothetical protein
MVQKDREWGMGNGEWGMGNGEWVMGNGEWVGVGFPHPSQFTKTI